MYYWQQWALKGENIVSKKPKKKNKRQMKQEQEITIIGDVKEPFTWQRFWDEKIVGNWRKFKFYLEDKGILFFLTSPFQYRNRMIVILILITTSVLLGIVPRLSFLVQQTRERNASSEMVSIEGRKFTNNNIVMTPLMSSHVDNQHVLAFLIQGDTKDGVPSTADGYHVYLSVSRGVSDFDTVAVKYDIIPMDDTNRVLLVYTDNRQQTDTTGVYELNVSVKGLPLMKYGGMEVILSSTQEQTQLFNGVYMDLTSLSPILSKLTQSTQDGPITQNKQAVDKALETYRLTEDRLKASNMTLSPSYEEMKAWVQDQSFLRGVEDDSTTGIVSVPIDQTPSILAPSITVKGVDGKLYSKEVTGNERPNQAFRLGISEATNAQGLAEDITSSLTQLNSSRLAKYQQLYNWSVSLNMPLIPEDLKEQTKVFRTPLEANDDANAINDKINQALMDQMELQEALQEPVESSDQPSTHD